MNYRFTTAVDEMDMDTIHTFLTECYWCKGIPRETVEKSVINSLSFGVLEDSKQIAFGRFVTDKATFAYLADVFVLPAYQGMGLGKMMMQRAMALPDLQGLRRLMLATRDAHGLYEPFGFKAIEDSQLFMQRLTQDVYD